MLIKNVAFLFALQPLVKYLYNIVESLKIKALKKSISYNLIINSEDTLFS